VLFGETLDIELRPFGVTVVTVMAGMIKSSWYQNSMPQLELPEDSLYHPVADAVRFGMEGLGNEKDGMEPDEFAELVIRDVLAGKKVVWRGGLSNMVYWVSNWMPKWVMDKVLWDMSGLKKMDGRQQI
jgi:short-subunit dehydrogenase